ncbi:MAG TPA: class I SAM-dependent methyltransferase [Acidobacteriaceae bacterium]|nr:class I SAM-dependent methyltransferase [Acidobacteriaceae bacterium]
MIDLERLRSDWDALAKRDALWAILTDGTKADGGWDVADFFETGEIEIATVMGYLGEVGCLPDAAGAALDFGCGVGRLTQAMGRRFAACVGVDISEEMIRRAEGLNPYAHCSYMTSVTKWLLFAEESFVFVYSNIVLQHMPRKLAVGYLREFVRVLEPGGVLVFGVQDSFVAKDVASRVERMRDVLRLRTRWKSVMGRRDGDMQLHLLSEAEVREAVRPAMVVDVRLTNTAAKDFNGRLVYLSEMPGSGYVGKQYCVVKPG